MTHTDYDLAILGGSLGSRLAAKTVAQQGARVALIAPTWLENDVSWHLYQGLYGLDIDRYPWPNVRDWVKHQCEHSRLSPTALRSHNIDVILEPASFTQSGSLTLAHRSLKASRYLLTDGYGWSSPPQSGLYCHQLLNLETLPQRITVIGYGASALEWAYGLSRLANVTLIVLALLPAEDEDIQRLVQAQFRSLDITVVLAKTEADIAVLQSEQDELTVTVPHPFNWQTAGLEKLGIAAPILVTSQLQTSCRQIYGTGGSLGGENRPELTQQETKTALANALWGRRQEMRYEQAFYGINLLSPIARWGLTEHQARNCYGEAIQIFQAACLPSIATHPAQTNFCKLITLGNRIVGAHFMGQGASVFVAALGARPTMTILHQRMGAVAPQTLGDAINQAIDQWKGGRWREGQWRRDWAENWFNFRRSC
ncbi:MAG: FAD-dependent oxidoreductase [Cyanobacteria bacterium P01_C01_bin.118]